MTKRTKHRNAPPEGQAWIWLTAQMMKSDAWRAATKNVNCKRIVEFLMVELMEHGGNNNGQLRAPYQQLEGIGISPRLIAGAIRQSEELGLVDCRRGGMRVATAYALTWLPLHDGTPPSNRWKQYSDPELKPWPKPSRKGTQP
jgi:hypothetical protein